MKAKCEHCETTFTVDLSDFLMEWGSHDGDLNIQLCCSSCGEQVAEFDVNVSFELNYK